jgi:hypothetical protein
MVWEPTAADLVADAVQRKLADIDRQAAVLQDSHLEYDGHLYYADQGSLLTIMLTLLVVLTMTDDEPVPTPPPVAGCWLTADRDQETGTRVARPMNCAYFKGFARYLYLRRAPVWGAKQLHYATVESMAAAGATAEQILGYDHTAGWPEVA